MQSPENQEQASLPESGEVATATQEAAPLAASQRGLSTKARSWLWDLYIAAVLVATFLVDQLTKGWIRGHLLLGQSVPEEGLLRFTHTTNTGSAFGLFPSQTALLMLASLVGIAVLVFFFRKQPIPGPWLRTSLGLQLGGAAGNLVDRITLGRVTDFIDVGPWPVFNIADASIVTGLIILAWFLLRSSPEASKAVIEEAEVHSSAEPQEPVVPASNGPIDKG